MIEEPSIGLLASAAGLAGVIFILTSLVRGLLNEAVFDRWGPTIAAIIGVILAELYVVVTTNPITGAALLQALLVGLFAGFLSQNINSLVKRAATST